MLTLNYLLTKHHYFDDIDKSAFKLNIDLKCSLEKIMLSTHISMLEDKIGMAMKIVGLLCKLQSFLPSLVTINPS